MLVLFFIPFAKKLQLFSSLMSSASECRRAIFVPAILHL